MRGEALACAGEVGWEDGSMRARTNSLTRGLARTGGEAARQEGEEGQLIFDPFPDGATTPAAAGGGGGGAGAGRVTTPLELGLATDTYQYGDGDGDGDGTGEWSEERSPTATRIHVVSCFESRACHHVVSCFEIRALACLVSEVQVPPNCSHRIDKMDYGCGVLFGLPLKIST